MGIAGLIPFVEAASKKVHLSEFKGQTVAIDSYCWLHKGAFSCAEKLVKGEKTDAYVSYCFKYIDMLRSFKITPIMVFDGQNLPAKTLTEKKRCESRELARKRAVECLKLGKVGEARMNFIKGVDITPEIALNLIKACRKKSIDCIVAPYEADAQLAYLNHLQIADLVITEDSDLIVFGCSKILFKVDLSGYGTLVEADKLYLPMKEKRETFSLDKFRYMCILSGCDYLDSLPGIGLKKALKFIKTICDSDIYDVIAKLPITLNMKQLIVTKEYRESFMIANATFRHQLVFDPLKRKIVPLADPEISGTKLEYCSNAGTMLENEVAYQIALGNVNPITLEVMDKWCPDKHIQNTMSWKNSIWSKSYRIQKKVKRESCSTNKVPSTKGIDVICSVNLPNSTHDDKILLEKKN